MGSTLPDKEKRDTELQPPYAGVVNRLGIENFSDIWRVYSPLTHLSRCLGIVPWSMDNHQVPTIKLKSWVTVYTIIVHSIALYFQVSLIILIRTTRMKKGDDYDLAFLEILAVVHPICQLWFFVSGFLNTGCILPMLTKMQNIIDSFSQRDKEDTLNVLRRRAMVSTMVYVGYASIYAATVTIGNLINIDGSIDKTTIVHQVIRGCGAFVQLCYASYGFCLFFIITVSENAVNVMISAITNSIKDKGSDGYSKESSHYIDYLNTTYTMVADFLEESSIQFGNILLVQIGLTGLDLLLCTYTVFVASVEDIGIGTSVFHAVGASFYLAFICNVGTQLSVAGRSLLRAVIRKSKEKDISESECKQLVLLRDNIINDPLRVNAGNFCLIDRTLIISIIGGVSTYLVVLIQFKTTHQ